jgi:hypothetical protein
MSWATFGQLVSDGARVIYTCMALAGTAHPCALCDVGSGAVPFDAAHDTIRQRQ